MAPIRHYLFLLFPLFHIREVTYAKRLLMQRPRRQLYCEVSGWVSSKRHTRALGAGVQPLATGDISSGKALTENGQQCPRLLRQSWRRPQPLRQTSTPDQRCHSQAEECHSNTNRTPWPEDQREAPARQWLRVIRKGT